jgi:hypothetical protein
METHCKAEKGVLQKIAKVNNLINLINREVSKQLIRKSQTLHVDLTQDLKEKCAIFLSDYQDLKLYYCKICNKRFDDGRKLGGHVSRAHKDRLKV